MSATIELDESAYPPGSTLRGRVALTPLAGDEGRNVELTVLWQTEGKGDTDIGVVHHQILASGDPVAARATHSFAVVLPPLPLSYDGHLVKIGWLVRVRRLSAFTADDDVVDARFLVAWPA